MNLDLREGKRFKYEANIWHESILPGRFYKARICNISRNGLYFESDQTLYQGEEIYISGSKPESSGNIPVNCARIEIKWRKDLQDSSFQFGYGAEFLEPDNPFVKTVDKKKLIRRDVKRSDGRYKKDPREHIREIYRKEIVFTIQNHEYKGFITNISRGGTFITTKDIFALGHVIQLDLQLQEDSACKDVKLKGWVVRLSPKGIGVKFDRRIRRDRRKNSGQKDRRRHVRKGRSF
jgi:Tfp pilus assembly protein PilZ